jgi:hypothetical protein
MAFLRVRGGSVSIVHGERKGLSVRHRRLHTFPGGASDLSACLEASRWARLQVEVEQRHPDVLIDWNRLRTDAQKIVDKLEPDRPPLTANERIRAVQKACRVLRRRLRELPHDGDDAWALRCVGREVADTTRHLAWAMRRLMGAPERDVEMILKVLLPDAETNEMWVDKARAAAARGNHAKAREAFERARVADPSDPDIDNSEAIGYLERGMHAEAELLFQRARDMAYLQLPNPDRSYGWGELEVRPYVRATSNLALLRERQGRHEEALALYQECLRICPNDGVQARFAIGRAYQRMGNLHQSILHNAEHCYGNLADIPDPFYDMTSALVQLNRIDEAFDRLMEAMRINHHIALLLLKPPRRKVAAGRYLTLDSREWALAYLREHADLWPPASMDFLRAVLKDRALRLQLDQIEALQALRETEKRSEAFKELSALTDRVFAPEAVDALKKRLKMG